MTMRIGSETVAQIDSAWPAVLDGVRAGELIRDILARHTIKSEHLYAYMRLKGADARQEWEDARLDSADALYDEAMVCARGNADKFEAAHMRTRIDTLKWAARIRNPKLYGDRADLNINVIKTVNLNAIIAAADARLAHARDAIAGESRRISEPVVALAQLADIL